jgi:hypothetical protein
VDESHDGSWECKFKFSETIDEEEKEQERCIVYQ